MDKVAENKYAILRMKAANFKVLWQQIWVLPNLLSISRLLFLPVVIYFIIINKDILAIIAMGLVWISDYIDGYVARKFKQKTELGLLLDPIADKITSAFIFLTLLIFRDFPLWVFIVVVGRDIIILTGGYLLFKRGNLVQSNEIGRKTAVILCAIILLYFFNLENWYHMGTILSTVLVFMIIASLTSYTIRYFQVPRNFDE